MLLGQREVLILSYEEGTRMNVKILYLYPDFMNLYGDNGNVRILKKRLEDQGFDVEITSFTVTDYDLSFEGVDFVFMGSGYESNRNIVIKHFRHFKDSFIKAVEDGIPMLFTGNSYDILCTGVTISEFEFMQGLGLFNVTFSEPPKKRYRGDVILELPDSKERYVGFVNRAGFPEDTGDLTCNVIKVIGDVPMTKDGVHVNNLYGFSLIGPMLLKNPSLADMFVEIICSRKGVQVKPVDYPHSLKSHVKTLKALLETVI